MKTAIQQQSPPVRMVLPRADTCLRVPEVPLSVDVVDAVRDGCLVLTVRPHVLTLLAYKMLFISHTQLHTISKSACKICAVIYILVIHQGKWHRLLAE